MAVDGSIGGSIGYPHGAWRPQIQNAFAELIQAVSRVRDIDLMTGVLPVGLLWPLRNVAHNHPDKIRQLLQPLIGDNTIQLISLIAQWGDDPATTARQLSIQATSDSDLAAILHRLTIATDGARLFAEQFVQHYVNVVDAQTVNIGDIHAAVVTVGGVTTIDTLTLHLHLPSPPPVALPTYSIFVRRISVIVGAVILLSASIIIYQFVRPLVVPPPRMTGDLNVAIARFGALDAHGQPTASIVATDLSDSVFKVMHDELAATITQINAQGVRLDIEVLDPDKTGRIEGRTPEARAQSAQELADAINADIIVYGNLMQQDATSQFVPEFYLANRNLGDARELSGQYNFGTTITSDVNVATNLVARSALRGQLIARTGVLVDFIVGMGFYVTNQMETADHYFAQAAHMPGWDDHDGKEVVYLFQGNVAGRRGDLPQAQEYFTQALQLNPEYARAQIGAADITYIRAAQNCEEGQINPQGVMEAITAYQRAQQLPDQPPLADIVPKTHYRIGRAYVCLTQALIGDYRTQARGEFDQVLTAFEQNSRLRAIASETHSQLGFLALPAADDADAKNKYRQALTEYETAITLSQRPDRKAFFQTMRGYILAQLHDQKGLEQAYATAIALNPADRLKYEEELHNAIQKLEKEP